jgi:oxygen-independent coproporphyrinogen-3 oxidase
MYHIVKSFLPDAEISQKVDPEQELLIEMTAEEEPDLEEQACDKKVRWTFFSVGE